MAIQPFNFEMLPKLDSGLLAALFNRDMDRAVADCKERPAENKPRTITIEFSVVPFSENPAINDCDAVVLTWKIKPKHPDSVSRPYNMALRGNKVFFNPDSPDDAEQQTIFDAQERKEDRRNG